MNPWIHIIVSGVIITAGGVWQGYGWYLKNKDSKETIPVADDERLHFKDSEFNTDVKDTDEATGMQVDRPATFSNTKVNLKAENVRKAAGFSTNQGLSAAIGFCPVHNRKVPVAVTGPLPETFTCQLCGQKHPLKSK